MSPAATGGVTKDDLEKRREEARKLVAQIQSRERQIEAQYREYLRQKAEYEKRVAEYEKQRREQLQSYGLDPDSGVSSDNDIEIVESDE